jgi:hypothetical protein
MRGRRDKNHHAQALTRVCAALLAAGLALAPAGPFLANEQKVGRDGLVHRVSAESANVANQEITSLVHSEQGPEGGTTRRMVTGTEDDALDVEPALAIDPVTEQPVVVWARDEGTGFDLYVSRFTGAVWTPPIRILFIPGEDLDPRVQVGRNLVHVVWPREAPSGTQWVRLSLDRVTLEPVYGPEILPSHSPSIVPADGGSGDSGGTVDPSSDDTFFFGAEIPPREPGDPGEIVIWGVRDEPIPIDYVQSFFTPASLQSAGNISAGWVGSRFAVTFETPGGFYYRFRDGGTWSDLRVIRLDAETGSAQAWHQMAEMLLRIGPDLAD